MAYTVLFDKGHVGTYKQEETVVVQGVQVTNREGVAQNRLEARLNVDNPRTGYHGATKTALVFEDPDDVQAFIEALQEGLADFKALRQPEQPQQPARAPIQKRKPNAAAAEVRQLQAARKAAK